MKKLFLLIPVFLIAIACNKDQAAVKKLDGTWTINKLEIETELFGIPIALDMIELGGHGTMTFDACKLKKDEWCNVSSNIFNPVDSITEISSDLYRVIDDGTTLETKESDTSSTTTLMTITELTKTSLKVNWVENGDPVNAELTKD